MNLSLDTLFADQPVVSFQGNRRALVTALCTDSRRVAPGAIFFALGGLRTDGQHYVEEAVHRGAVAVVSDRPGKVPPRASYIEVENIREVLAEVARRFYQHPENDLRSVGITGTNGKTTVSLLTRHLLQQGGNPAGLIGTISYDVGVRTLPAARTTPEAIDIYALMAQMREAGCKEMVMEVSSHGIEQRRVHRLPFKVAAFLNLTRDHLDYHHGMDEYYAVKRRLFSGEIGALPELAVINRDDVHGRQLLRELPSEVRAISFGEAPEASFRAVEVHMDATGTEFILHCPAGRFPVFTPLLGRYNLSNTLAALAIAYAMGRDVEACVQALRPFQGVPGRMERVEAGQEFTVLVDYAHTDDALRNALQMLRPITKGRLLVVFGCGGDRDREKRPLMTTAALEGADFCWATSDNPRSESIQQIFDDMRGGLGEATHYRFVEDRRWAIHLALQAARSGDTVLIAGKGHETFQEFADSVVPFDDRQVAREILLNKLDMHMPD